LQAAKGKLLVMHKRLKNICKEATCDSQAASVNNLKIMKHSVPCTLKLHLLTINAPLILKVGDIIFFRGQNI
jgi:hypothetical protein